ncbi:MAG TPA: hypothetical protein VN616_07550 [Puia sp.]|nr:hypothetical protein [Puia sp.]
MQPIAKHTTRKALVRYIRRLTLIPVIALLAVSCARTHTPEDTKTRLKAALYHSLVTAKGYDSTLVRYKVLDVIYYDDATRTKSYICRFKVNMVYKGKDTTGTMYCYIPKDFSRVDRKW